MEDIEEQIFLNKTELLSAKSFFGPVLLRKLFNLKSNNDARRLMQDSGIHVWFPAHNEFDPEYHNMLNGHIMEKEAIIFKNANNPVWIEDGCIVKCGKKNWARITLITD